MSVALLVVGEMSLAYLMAGHFMMPFTSKMAVMVALAVPYVDGVNALRYHRVVCSSDIRYNSSYSSLLSCCQLSVVSQGLSVSSCQ
jgi:hypothetical protein